MRADAIPEVAIRKTNTSVREILKFPIPDRLFDWIVRNPKGDKLTLRSVDSHHCWIVAGRPGFFKGAKDMFLRPGESTAGVNPLVGVGHPMSGENDNCRSGFDMSQPGTYTVQAVQRISSDLNSPEIQSNIIAIKVVTAENAPR